MSKKKEDALDKFEGIDLKALESLVEKLKEKELKDPKTGEAYYVTNNQKCSWIVPLQMLGIKTYVGESIVYPGRGVEIDKGRFDFQYLHSKVFRYMIDTKLLYADKRIKKLDLRDLKRADPVQPPPELGGEGEVERLDVVSQAVCERTSVNLTSNRDLATKGK